ENPRIAMVAKNDPAILFLSAIDSDYYVPDSPLFVIHVGFQADFYIGRAANVISERQTTLKTSWSHWPLQWSNQRFGNVVSNRLNWNTRKISCLFRLQPRNTGYRWLTRC